LLQPATPKKEKRQSLVNKLFGSFLGKKEKR
jgi:hypothetical protein